MSTATEQVSSATEAPSIDVSGLSTFLFQSGPFVWHSMHLLKYVLFYFILSALMVRFAAPEQLEQHVVHQVEYYFSPENLAKDHYLVSLMNSEGFVPLRTVANFKLVQHLSSDFDFVVASLRKSKNLIIDETGSMIKTGFKPQRTTLIIREVLPTATLEVRVVRILHLLLSCCTSLLVSILPALTTISFVILLCDVFSM